jgi:hypothetical protein
LRWSGERFVTSAICGLRPYSASPSSCHDDSSITTGVSGPIASSCSSAEMPMFPATTASARHAVSIAAQRLVVVVFPFVPVTPMIGAGQWRKKRLISISIGTPAARAAASSGDSRGTAGFRTTSSVSVKSCSRCSPSR